MLKIGILALQGAFLEHEQMLDVWEWHIFKSGNWLIYPNQWTV